MSENPGEKVRFYNLSLAERLAWIGQKTGLTAEELAALSGAGGLDAAQANHMVENVVGVHTLPLGIAQNFIVNGREVLVPMAIEEPSVVAGASFMARLAQAGGGFFASADALFSNRRRRPSAPVGEQGPPAG
jgi:hydroxymethylglutaryl-CoA reductase